MTWQGPTYGCVQHTSIAPRIQKILASGVWSKSSAFLLISWLHLSDEHYIYIKMKGIRLLLNTITIQHKAYTDSFRSGMSHNHQWNLKQVSCIYWQSGSELDNLFHITVFWPISLKWSMWTFLGSFPIKMIELFIHRNSFHNKYTINVTYWYLSKQRSF
jgi:hypothetical protein